MLICPRAKPCFVRGHDDCTGWEPRAQRRQDALSGLAVDSGSRLVEQ
jgi:hypothetical protein